MGTSMVDAHDLTGEQTERLAGTERLVAFSDGVFAIAITLLVLNLVPPQVQHGLLPALGREWPRYLGYVTSFIIIGILWANHHHIFIHITRANHTLLIINVIFLLWVAVLPFPTALLANYLANPVERRTVVVIYAATFLVGAVLFNLLWRYGTHNHRLTGKDPDLVAIEKTNRSYAMGPIFYLLDVALSFVSPEAGLALFFLLSLLFALSPFPGSVRMPASAGQRA